jgi:hypothetical protein
MHLLLQCKKDGSLSYLKSNLLYQYAILIFIMIFRLHVAGKDTKIIPYQNFVTSDELELMKWSLSSLGLQVQSTDRKI